MSTLSPYLYLFLNAKFPHLELLALHVEGHFRAHKGGKEVYKDAEAQCHRKTLYGAASELEEDEGCNKGRNVRVYYAPPGPVVARVNGRARGPAVPELLLYPLEYEDVRIHAHPYGEYYAGYARERQSGAEPGHDPEEHYDVQEYGEVGDYAGEPVVNEHEDDHEEAAQDGGLYPGLYGVLTEGGAHGHVLDNVDGRRQRPGPQYYREVGSLLSGKAPGYLRPAP